MITPDSLRLVAYKNYSFAPQRFTLQGDFSTPLGIGIGSTTLYGIYLDEITTSILYSRWAVKATVTEIAVSDPTNTATPEPSTPALMFIGFFTCLCMYGFKARCNGISHP